MEKQTFSKAEAIGKRKKEDEQEEEECQFPTYVIAFSAKKKTNNKMYRSSSNRKMVKKMN